MESKCSLHEKVRIVSVIGSSMPQGIKIMKFDEANDYIPAFTTLCIPAAHAW